MAHVAGSFFTQIQIQDLAFTGEGVVGVAFGIQRNFPGLLRQFQDGFVVRCHLHFFIGRKGKGRLGVFLHVYGDGIALHGQVSYLGLVRQGNDNVRPVEGLCGGKDHIVIQLDTV